MMTSHPNTTPLDLSNAVMIGSGTERDCYQHPNNPNLCIKVNNGKVLPNKKQRAKQNQIEYSYYLRLQKRHQQPTVIPQCYGWIETSQGPGLVFDLILNEDGSAAPRLLTALDNSVLSIEQAKRLLSKLKQHMLQERIIPSDLHPDNILVHQTGAQFRLVLVDGIGNRNLFKFAEVIPALGRMKIERHWSRLMSRLHKKRPAYFSNPGRT